MRGVRRRAPRRRHAERSRGRSRRGEAVPQALCSVGSWTHRSYRRECEPTAVCPVLGQQLAKERQVTRSALPNARPVATTFWDNLRASAAHKKSRPIALGEYIADVLYEQFALFERIIYRQRWVVGVGSLIGVDIPTALDGGARTLRLFYRG